MIRKFIILYLSIFLVGCSLPNLSRDNLVKTSSSAAGGYLGYHLSDGDFFTTSVGSTIGLIVGENLAEFIGQNDNYYFTQETLRILEISDNNHTTKNHITSTKKNNNNDDNNTVTTKNNIIFIISISSSSRSRNLIKP